MWILSKFLHISYYGSFFDLTKLNTADSKDVPKLPATTRKCWTLWIPDGYFTWIKDAKSKRAKHLPLK